MLNKDKFVLRTDSITFMGHVVAKDGLKSDPEKMRAISDFPVLQKVDDEHRFLGMAHYMSKFYLMPLMFCSLSIIYLRKMLSGYGLKVKTTHLKVLRN